MKISIFGLGYVGSVTAACLAEMGHDIIGFDTDAGKRDMLAKGNPCVIERDLTQLTLKMVQSGKLKTAGTSKQAIEQSGISLICVGTPSLVDGSIDCSYLEKVCQEIGSLLQSKSEFHIVVVRSTLMPNTMRSKIIPLLESASGKKAGTDFGVCNNPEFLREGSAIYDFYYPAKTVIGATDKKTGDIIEGLYDDFPCPLIRCEIEVAEMIKYADNCWHATKIVFANEIGTLCQSMQIDSHTVMEIFCQDTKLNLSSHYLKPAFAFGGSCLPKDIRALGAYSSQANLPTPLLSSLLPSNAILIQRGVEMILATKSTKIGILGYSFKAGTNDIRESPMVMVIDQLLENGITPLIYDLSVNLAVASAIAMPNYLSPLMSNSLAEVLSSCDIIVIGNKSPEFASIGPLLLPHHSVIDFVRIKEIELNHPNYHGICW